MALPKTNKKRASAEADSEYVDEKLIVTTLQSSISQFLKNELDKITNSPYNLSVKKDNETIDSLVLGLIDENDKSERKVIEVESEVGGFRLVYEGIDDSQSIRETLKNHFKLVSSTYSLIEYATAKSKLPANLASELTSTRLYRKIEEERTRFSNYLHDGVLQDILALDRILEESDSEVFLARIEIAKIVKSIRGQIGEYSSGMLKELSLSENLKILINKQKNQFPDFDWKLVIGEIGQLTSNEEKFIYRAAKELTNNAGKHSAGDNVRVFLTADEFMVKLIVDDNGIGMDGWQDKVKYADGHIGLLSLMNDVRYFAGELIISQSKIFKQGTRVEVKLMRGIDSENTSS